MILHSPQLEASSAQFVQRADIKAKGMGKGENVIPYDKAYIGFRQLDLTGIKQLEINAAAQRREGSAGGTIEIRLDAPTGPLIGEKTIELAPEVDIAKLMAEMESAEKAGASAKSGPPAAGGPGAPATKPGGPPAPRNPFARPPVHLSLKATEGVHDVYFVFRNDQAKAIQPLMSLSSIKFMNNEK